MRYMIRYIFGPGHVTINVTPRNSQVSKRSTPTRRVRIRTKALLSTSRPGKPGMMPHGIVPRVPGRRPHKGTISPLEDWSSCQTHVQPTLVQ